jgi:tetratricopeptide (TPR) repeat protein
VSAPETLSHIVRLHFGARRNPPPENLRLSLQMLSRVLSLCLLFSLGPVMALQQSPEALSPLEQAQQSLESGNSDEVIRLLTPFADSEQPALARHLLGIAYYQKGQYTQAIGHLAASAKGSLHGGAQQSQAQQLLGLSHYFMGQIPEAILRLEQFVQSGNLTLEVGYVLANCYIQSRQPDKARDQLARMFELDRQSPGAHLVTAQMMIRQQFEDFAEKELRRALELDPRLPQAHFHLGELAIFRADIDGGIQLLRREIEINPGYAMAHYRLGEALTRQQKWDEAIPPLQKSIWLNPFFSGPFIVLGKVYLKKDDLENAESILRRALVMDTNNYSGHHLLAQVLQKAGRREEARNQFRLAERLRNSSSED